MASALFELLADLAKDPTKLERFKKDPESFLAETDLSDDHKRALHSAVKNNRQQDLLKALGDEAHDKFGSDFVC